MPNNDKSMIAEAYVSMYKENMNDAPAEERTGSDADAIAQEIIQAGRQMKQQGASPDEIGAAMKAKAETHGPELAKQILLKVKQIVASPEYQSSKSSERIQPKS